MRFNEFMITEKAGRAGNKQTRYNTEVGLLIGFLGIDPTTFDPANPEASIPKGAVADHVYKDIKKFLAPNFNPKMFAAWASKATAYTQKINNKLGATPTKFDWAGGANVNDEGAADIEFLDVDVHGLSVKAESGITLANLTPKSLGLEVAKGNDIFFQYAGDEYIAMKNAIFNAVMDVAESQPGQRMGWHNETPEKYSITYHGGIASPKAQAQPAPQQPDELDVVKKNAGIPQQQFQAPVARDDDYEEDPTNDLRLSESKEKEGTFTITGKRNFSGTREQILAAIGKNSPWQRVFGDWYQAHYATHSELAKPLFNAVAGVFKDTIISHLSKDRKLDAILRMGKNPYFYCNASDIYYVPSISEVDDLQVKNVYYGSMTAEGEVKEAEGTSQKFQAEIGRPDSEKNAKILIYIRYANGMFEANPTVRVQDLKDAQYLGWELL